MPTYDTKHHDWLMVGLALGALVLGVLFVSVGAYVLGGIFGSTDQALRNWTMNGRSPTGITISTVVSFIGDKLPLTVLCAIIGWWLIPGQRWWLLLLVLCAVSVTGLVDWLKATYEVIRPVGGQLTSSSHSYPSGHASGTAAIALFFSYISVRHRAHPRIIVPAAMLLTVLVGLSRIYLDEHWGSDVIGGWMVGAAIAMLFGALYEMVLRYQRTVYANRS